MLQIGTVAPDFTLLDQDSQAVSLAGLRGHWVLLWWYPKASTSGCTAQGRSLRDRSDDLTSVGCVVLGASFDTPEDNKTFAVTERFGFRLLSDTDKEVGARYEVTREPDEEYAALPKRVAYVIDPEGVVRMAYDVTDVHGFAAQVLADLEAAKAG